MEVAQKDAKGVRRSPIELRIAASNILLNGLSVALESVLTPLEIGKSHFDEVTKEQIFRESKEAIYKVIQEHPRSLCIPLGAYRTCGRDA